MGFIGTLWEGFILFKRKFWSITSGAMISPILYIIAFGWGIGGNVKVAGHNYINFIIPGIVALNTMMVSFNSIGISINISRIYDKTFEEFMIAPINMMTYSLAKITAGALRGMYSGTLIIILCIAFRIGLHVNLYFMFILILNCLVFSSIGFAVGILIESHADLSKFSSFIITPMSFLCGTFFPLERMPILLRKFIWILPLTHTSTALRNTGESMLNMSIHILVLLIYFIVMLFIGVKNVKNV